jgi:hypothetical protein
MGMRVRGLAIGFLFAVWANASRAEPVEAAPPPASEPAPATAAPAAPVESTPSAAAAPAPAPEAPAPAPAPPEAPAPPPAEAPAPPPAAAPEAPPPSAAPSDRFPGSPHALFTTGTDARRHVGLSVRVTVGAGYGSADHDRRKGEAKVSGPNGLVSIDVGGTPIEDLIVFGRISGFGVDHAGSSDSDNAGAAFFAVIGPGARYHFMPFDWYVSGMLGLSLVSVVDNVGEAQNAGPGFGFELETGKNWWAGSYRDRWTIGLGLRFAYARSGSARTAENDKSHEPWQGTALSLVFSTAYN